MASAQEALEKVQATAKSIADKTDEVKKSVEGEAVKSTEGVEKSKKDIEDDEVEESAKKSEKPEDKPEDKDEDKKEKSESTRDSGKVEHKTAPEKDPASKSVEADTVAVKGMGADYLETVNKSLELVDTMFTAYKELAKSMSTPAEDKAEKSAVEVEKSEDKPEDKEDEDKEEKSESTENCGKLHNEKAPEGDPASKSEKEDKEEDEGEGEDKEAKKSEDVEKSEDKAEKSMAVVAEGAEDKEADKAEKSMDNKSDVTKDEFLGAVSKSIRNMEHSYSGIDYTDAIKSLHGLKDQAKDAEFISNDMVAKYNEI